MSQSQKVKSNNSIGSHVAQGKESKMSSSYGKAFLKGMKSMMMFGASKSNSATTTAALKDKSSPTVEEQRYQQNS